MQYLNAAILAACLAATAAAKPVVFWAPDSVEPGNVVMLYGGGLTSARQVVVSRLRDGLSARDSSVESTTSQPAIQPSDNSVKFILPRNFKPGVFLAEVKTADATSDPVILNRPQIWFAQPTVLQPGLMENQAAPGDRLQVIGKNFLLPDDKGQPFVSLFPSQTDGDGKPLFIPAESSERFSREFQLPANLPEGTYRLHVGNGFGGPYGISEPLTLEIKRPDPWPAKVFNVKEYGAVGDDVHDDTQAIRDALAAADKNGGGVVQLPWGTYRLKDWICIPERTVLRGEVRDGTILKWPVDEPKTLADFSPIAVYVATPGAIENVTLIARKVDTMLALLCAGLPVQVPEELGPKMKPFGQARDFFLRNVNFAHWLMCQHPDRNAELWPKKYTGEGSYNVRIGNVKNFEVSNCYFEGGNQHFMNVRHGRITDNHFGNEMGYCWTCLGGGAHHVICTGNEIRASSSWGYGASGMNCVYSAHNESYNFVRGEREAMTLDISALPTQRPVTQYWGTPIEVGGNADKAFLKFPPPGAKNSDGFATGFVPGCFRGGTATIRAYTGGPGKGQSRKILGNTADTIELERPFKPAPDTTPRKLYIEIAPRGGNGSSAAWFGLPREVEGLKLAFDKADWVPQEFVDMAVMVLDGPGVGQYRLVTSNTKDELTIDRPWDVVPTAASSLGIWSLMRHMIVYQSEGYDCSAFSQLYGSFYDFTVDSCRVERNQGIWGQSGWFVRFCYNDVAYGQSYHPGIGPHGNNPEGNCPFSFVGLTDGNLRITKFGALQYGVPGGKPIFVNQVLPHPVPGAWGAIVKGNVLRYNQRVAFPPSAETQPRDQGQLRFVDVVIDGNRIEHSAVGVQVGPHVRGVLASDNHFEDVGQPYLIAKPSAVQVLDDKAKR